MSLKRARSALSAGSFIEAESGEASEQRLQAAKEIRSLVISKYSTGKWSAHEVCELSYWHTLSGGSGLEDFGSIRPSNSHKHGSDHVKKLVSLSVYVNSALTLGTCSFAPL
jgi:hypothetical protein